MPNTFFINTQARLSWCPACLSKHVVSVSAFHSFKSPACHVLTIEMLHHLRAIFFLLLLPPFHRRGLDFPGLQVEKVGGNHSDLHPCKHGHHKRRNVPRWWDRRPTCRNETSVVYAQWVICMLVPAVLKRAEKKYCAASGNVGITASHRLPVAKIQLQNMGIPKGIDQVVRKG